MSLTPTRYPMSPTPTRYGTWHRLQQLRELAELSIADLARAAGMSKSYLSRLESGERWPSRTMTKALAAALHVPIRYIERHKDAA